jgi:hypothetical protein
MPIDLARLSDEDRAAIQKLKERDERHWLEIMDKPEAPIDAELLLAVRDEVQAILAKYDTGNLYTAHEGPPESDSGR